MQDTQDEKRMIDWSFEFRDERGLSALKEYDSAEIIRLDNNDLDELDLSAIGPKPLLKVIWLDNNQLTSLDLEPLSDCPKLSVIGLNNNQLKALDLSPLQNCEELSELWLSNNQLDTIELEPLSQSPQLKILALDDNSLKEIDLSPLQNCSHLKELRLNRNQIEEISLSSLNSESIEEIHLQDNQIRELDLSPLNNSTNLWCLLLEQNRFSDIEISPLYSCSRLIHLSLDRAMHTTARQALQDVDEKPFAIQKMEDEDMIEYIPERPVVFIAYNTDDGETAKRIDDNLMANECDPRLYEYDVAPGDSISSWMQEGLEEANSLVLLWSEHAAESFWVKKEYTDFLYKMASDSSAKLILVRLDSTSVPPLIREYRWISCDEDFSGVIKQLVWGITGDRNIEVNTLESLQEKVIDKLQYTPMPYVLCPECGSSDIEQEFHVVESEGIELVETKCMKCGWKITDEI